MNKIYAIYDDEEILIEGINKLKSNNVKIHEVYTPFPVHGLDKVLGLKFSRLGVCAFIYGICGLCFAMLMMGYMMTIDWPQIIGGKDKNLSLERAIDLSAKKYCSASMMLNKTAQITYDFEILEQSLG